MTRKIPNTAVEIKTGLYLNQTPVTIAGNDFTRYELYSNKKYCFYAILLKNKRELKISYRKYLILEGLTL